MGTRLLLALTRDELKIYVKDIPFTLFEDLQQEQKLEGSTESMKKVYDLIDCTELNKENGAKMLLEFGKEE
jgi:hypothetical protein